MRKLQMKIIGIMCYNLTEKVHLDFSGRTSTHSASRTVILTFMNLLNTKALYNLSTINFMKKLYR